MPKVDQLIIYPDSGKPDRIIAFAAGFTAGPNGGYLTYILGDDDNTFVERLKKQYPNALILAVSLMYEEDGVKYCLTPEQVDKHLAAELTRLNGIYPDIKINYLGHSLGTAMLVHHIKESIKHERVYAEKCGEVVLLAPVILNFEDLAEGMKAVISGVSNDFEILPDGSCQVFTREGETILLTAEFLAQLAKIKMSEQLGKLSERLKINLVVATSDKVLYKELDEHPTLTMEVPFRELFGTKVNIILLSGGEEDAIIDHIFSGRETTQELMSELAHILPG